MTDWISVKERLPDTKRRVLVAFVRKGSRFVTEAWSEMAAWAEAKCFWYCGHPDDHWRLDGVYAWREMPEAPPLPEPPKETR